LSTVTPIILCTNLYVKELGSSSLIIISMKVTSDAMSIESAPGGTCGVYNPADMVKSSPSPYTGSSKLGRDEAAGWGLGWGKGREGEVARAAYIVAIGHGGEFEVVNSGGGGLWQRGE
jgi:hypothetical protein